MLAQATHTLSVSELNQQASQCLEQQFRVVHVVGEILLERIPEAVQTEALPVLILTPVDHVSSEHAAPPRVPMTGTRRFGSCAARLMGRCICGLTDGFPCPFLNAPSTSAGLRYDDLVAALNAAAASP